MTNFRSLVPGGFFSADPNNKDVRRSIRTNNPGAINTANWVKLEAGFVGEQPDGAGNNTAIFETPEHGVRAWRRLLERYQASIGPLSLAKILKRYTGGGEAYTNYLAFVSAKSGVSPDALVNLPDLHQMLPIARAFFHYEAGMPSPLSDAQVSFGLGLDKPTPAAADLPSQAKLAAFAAAEAALELTWIDATSTAEKYLAPLRPIMRKLGHIGSKPVFYDWCAAFVTWNCRQVGYMIPDQPPGFWASMALVESWRHWSKDTGTYRSPDTPLQAGDIVMFEWFDGDNTFDHIGIFLRHDGANLVTAEGNRKNKSGFFQRNLKNVGGIVRLG